jgi:hypothetical protein
VRWVDGDGLSNDARALNIDGRIPLLEGWWRIRGPGVNLRHCVYKRLAELSMRVALTGKVVQGDSSSEYVGAEIKRLILQLL